jgi:hypothetical protein
MRAVHGVHENKDSSPPLFEALRRCDIAFAARHMWQGLLDLDGARPARGGC